MPYIGKQPLTGAYQLCDAIVTSATATYNLLVGGSAVIPGSANNCIVSLNGVVQAPVGAFTVSGSQITFASTLSATDVIDFILILGNTFDIGTPTNGAVTNSSLNSNVITGQTAETTIAGGDLVLIYDDSASALRKMTRANFIGSVGGFETQLLHVRDEKAAPNSGGTGSTSFTARDLNTVMTNEITGASLASNQITLPAGTYYIQASAPVYNSDSHKIKLRNTTDSSDTIIGSSERGGTTSNSQSRSILSGRFTIAAQKVFEIQHRLDTTGAGSDGLGVRSNMSVTEVYTDVQIWKVA